VVFFLLAVAVALLVVPLTKGSFHRLSRLQFSWLWLLLLALIVQFLLELVDFPKDRIDDLGVAILLLSYAMIFGFCFLNRRVAGMMLITVGIALNVLVIALNQGMPTKDDVVTRNGHQVHVPIEHTVKHKPYEESDTLGFLGDKLSLPRVPNEQFSIGDIVICLGIIDLCFEASRVPRRRGVPVAS
jgi:cytochrome c biogenesis factor